MYLLCSIINYMAQGIKSGLELRKCVNCKKDFQPSTNWHVYCSPKCKGQFLHLRHRDKRRSWWQIWYQNKLKEDPDFNKKRYYKRKENNEKFREQRNRWAKVEYQKLRNLALEKYGNQCSCCREDKKEFLGIDHIEGGGTQHRKKMGRVHIYRWLYRNNYPEGFRVLCHNCNLALGFYNYCPHEKL